MAGIKQSTVPPSDPSAPWNTSQFSMGMSLNIDSQTNFQNKYFPIAEKMKLMPEENGILSQNMYQYTRQQTGFQSSNIMSNDKSFPTNMQSSLQNSMAPGNSTLNYNMFHRAVGDPSLYSIGNLDMSSQSKQGFSASSRIGGMSQFFDSSTHSYLPTTQHRNINLSSLNPNVPSFNGQMSLSKNRPGSYTNMDSHSTSIMNQWDTQIGNFDSSEFPSLKTKSTNLLSQMSSSSNYNYSLSNKSMGQINYQMVTKSGMPISQYEHTSEFSIQQEDFPALPVAQHPVTCIESQRSSSASGLNNPAVALNSCDSSSHSHNSSSTLPSTIYAQTAVSVVDPNDYLVTKNAYSSNYVESQFIDQGPMALSVSASSVSLPSTTNNSSQQTSSKVQKKIIQGPNNYIANIPNDMVADAFGLIGLVKLIGINDTYDNLKLLAPGVETLSLNRELESNKDIYHSYVSPLSSNCAGRPQDMDYPVPKEYRIRHVLLERLADPLPEKLADETLFWIFYNLTGEECQLTAARQLMARQWRYHKRERIWLTRDPSGPEPVTHASFERGQYLVWDWEKARRTPRPLTVYYKDLDHLGASGPLPRLPFCYNSPFLSKRSASKPPPVPADY